MVDYLNMLQYVERKLNIHVWLDNHMVPKDRRHIVMDLGFMSMHILLSYMLFSHMFLPHMLPLDLLLRHTLFPHLGVFLEAQRTSHYSIYMQTMVFLTRGKER